MNEQKNTTKTQIKQAAIRQIEKFGIDKTSMRSIAAEANMTTGAIYSVSYTHLTLPTILLV